MESVKTLIEARRSYRTFIDQEISIEDKKIIESCMHSTDNPFNIPVEFRMLDVKEYGLTSPVIVGVHTYVGAKVKRVPNFEMAFGYSFEKFCLLALDHGLGTVMLASTLNRPVFEKAMDVLEDEVMPVASPIGYPSKKMSLRESLMRKGIKADERKKFDTLFFDQSFEHGLTQEAAGEFAEALKMARLAPSAVNAQPLRAVIDGNDVHFYEVKSMKDSPLGDIQKVDIGIALAHFDMVLKEQGIEGQFLHKNPQIKVPENTYYMVSFERK